MLNAVKTQIIEMFETLHQAIEQALSGNLDFIVVKSFVESINNVVVKESKECAEAGKKLLAALEQYYKDKEITAIEEAFNSYVALFEDIPTQYKVVFLPYYKITWDCFESVWEAFKNDPMFVTQITIIPIRYNDKTVYEDYLTPKDIPNIPYEQYDFENEKPDIVFICQPYDGNNLPKFMSTSIKPHVGMLVYIPYYTYMHNYIPEDEFQEYLQLYTELSGHNAADLIVTSGPGFMNVFQEKSKNGHKMVALGSPKIDFLHKSKKIFPRYLDWEERIKGKITFMLNTNYTSFHTNTFDKYNNTPAWFDFLINYVNNNDELALIWRPHPLIFQFLSYMPDGFVQFIDRLRLGYFPRIIIDETESTASAFMYSDAVLTEWSSLVTDAIYLDKPTFSLHMDPYVYREDTRKYYEPIYDDIIAESKKIAEGAVTFHAVLPSSGAERHLQPGETIEDTMYCKPLQAFIEAIKAGEDPKADLRKLYIKDHLVNLNGNCGVTILNYIKENYL